MEYNKELSTICQDNGIILAYLFGSQAKAGLDMLKGNAVSIDDQLTDLDLGIIFTVGPPSPQELPGVYARLHNLLSGFFSPLALDLFFLQEQHSVFQANAVTGLCVYAANQDVKSEYEENVMRRAAGFRPFLERYLDEHLEEAAK